MNDHIVQRLLELNAEFYQTFATQFSDTRQRIQPGVRHLLETIPENANILDLGCGNGEFAQNLAEGEFCGRYLGLDFSQELLEVARDRELDPTRISFLQANLADPDWVKTVKHHQQKGISFDRVLAFAALHHLPGRKNHLKILNSVRSVLAANGLFIHSNWQFLNSERLRQRIHAWREIGLDDSDVEPGDYLLDWRRGGFGLRYVHHFSEDELFLLAEETGFSIIKTFYSDGESGDLGLYQVWKAKI